MPRRELDAAAGIEYGLTATGTQRLALFEHGWRRIHTMLDEIAEGPVTPSVDPAEIRRELAAYDFSAPRAAEQVLDACADWLQRWTTHVTHPRYFGLFNPRPATAAIVADAIVAAVNPQLATWTHSPAAVEIERHVIAYLGRRLGLAPESVAGTFTSGGTEANHTAVQLALTRAFPAYVEHGARALPGRPLIYASAEAHDSVVRIAQACGLGREALRHVAVDAQLKLDVSTLEQAVARDRAAGDVPFLVIATAETTSGGVIDPLVDVGAFCRAEGLAFHVDAAWAGGLALSDRARPLLAGIEGADSITLDAHKWLSAPMGAGVLLHTDEDALEATFALSTPYMPPVGAGADPFRISMQWSRRFIGLKVFAALAVVGETGFGQIIDRQIALGDHLRARARDAGWEIANPTPLPLVCLAHPDVTDPDRLAAAVIARGRVWLSATRLAGRAVIRTCITNVDSTAADVETILDELEAARDGLT